ncbi:DNA polymerase zeta processivity subunit [Eurytemora carolleeae]|uniref:DNA polymerase zeta processivity subunit n=1 Tax=Eurytemora carolleeae TaxID=1294199 RepID=UPI000C7613AE|nr:DNA polymerase zeta processivity subunit [Eurytemora carolleeae]|eukprot:XP_023336335.1 DNA polymerase zeta processivity subunit-like [Eurytemora affinis]
MTERTKETYLEVFLEFLEIFVHQVVYLREIYPTSIFVKKKKYRTPVMMSEHPWVNEYIERTLTSLLEYIKSPGPHITCIYIVLFSGGILQEKYVVEIDLQSILTSVSMEDEFWIKLELSFLSCLQRLSQVVQSSLKDLPEDIEWWLEVETTESGLLKLTKSLDWGIASSRSTTPSTNGILVPIISIDTPITFNLLIETYNL